MLQPLLQSWLLLIGSSGREMDFRSEKLLLVDIGGTNFRSAISYLGSDEVLETKKQNVECLENFSSLVNNLSLIHI